MCARYDDVAGPVPSWEVEVTPGDHSGILVTARSGNGDFKLIQAFLIRYVSAVVSTDIDVTMTNSLEFYP